MVLIPLHPSGQPLLSAHHNAMPGHHTYTRTHVCVYACMVAPKSKTDLVLHPYHVLDITFAMHVRQPDLRHIYPESRRHNDGPEILLSNGPSPLVLAGMMYVYRPQIPQ